MGDLPSRPDEPGITVYLVNHGWHAGIVLRRAEVSAELWPERDAFPGTEYLEVGWGDSDYYRTPDPHFGIALKAALLPTASVLHVVGFSRPVAAYFPHSAIIAIRLTEAGFARLCEYIAASFTRDATGAPVVLGPGLYGDSRFYRSHETYHLFNNCNAWAGRGLQAAGCPVRPGSIVRLATLMSRASACGEVVQQPPQ